MKSISATLIALLFMTLSMNAQSASQLYKFTDLKKSETVLKALSSELKLSESDFDKVKLLIQGSAQSQMEQFKSELAKDPDHVANIVRRQTTHIEGNLRNIIGEDKFKQYESLKPAIEKKAQELSAR
ncbi:MAG: hypothetical protein IPH78_11795 [Bacteroidetes bacterium]|nr:hypothetical protein [Bacteroidota bacterium]